MTITSGGNVGIGTSSPTCKLEVDGGSSAVGLRISTTNTGAGVAALILANSSKSAFNDGMIMAHGGGYTNITTLSGATIMAWDMSNCRVGIGTTSPTGLLEVYKSTSGGLGGHIILNNNGTAVGNETAVIFQDGGVGSVRAAISSTTEGAPYAGDIKFKTGLTSYGSLSTRMIITGAGNVGIGTCTPNFALEVCKTDGSVRFGTNTRHVLFCTQTLTGNISYTGFRYDDNGLVEVVKLLNNYSGTGYGNAIGFYGNGDKQMGYIKVSQTDASNTQAKMVIGVRCNDGAYDALSIFQGAVSCFAGQVCVASFTQGGGQSGNGFRKYISFGSAFNNPNQGLFNITSISTNSVLVAKVTVYQTAFGARASNVHTGYAMYYWDGCTTCAMSVEGNLGIGSVGTLAWCSSCLTYTANRVSNYDSYQVEVNWGGSSGNINLTWLA
jgi:hypothetical protein